MIIEELIALLGFDLKGEGDLNRFNNGLERARSTVRGLSGAMLAFGAAGAAAFAAALTPAAIALGKSVVDTGSEFEKLGIQLEALEGSKDKAKAALDWIQDFAIKTPLQLQEVVEGYAQLRTYGVDPTNGSFQALVDTMAMSGKGQEHLGGIITAVGQAWTKQKLQGEEAMQLLERGVPVWDLLSKAMGKTVPEIQELATKGKLGRKEIQLLIDAMGKRAAGASEKFSQSLTGILSNLEDLWTGFKKEIADAGFFEFVKDQFKDLLDGVNRFQRDGTITRWARTASEALTSVGRYLRSFVNGLIRVALPAAQRWGSRFGEVFASLGARILPVFRSIDQVMRQVVRSLSGGQFDIGEWRGLGLAIGLIAAALWPMAAAAAVAALAVDDLFTYLDGGDSIIGKAMESLRQYSPALATWADALLRARTEQEVYTTIVRGLNQALSALWQTFLAFPAVEGIVSAVRAIGAAMDAAATATRNAIAAVQEFLAIKAPNGFSMGLGTPPAPGSQPGAAAGGAVGSEIGRMLNNQPAPAPAAPEKRSSLEPRSNLDALLDRSSFAALGAKLAPTVNNDMNQTVTNNVTVNVAQTGASPGDIGRAAAGALSKASGSRNLFFTSDSPVAA